MYICVTMALKYLYWNTIWRTLCMCVFGLFIIDFLVKHAKIFDDSYTDRSLKNSSCLSAYMHQSISIIILGNFTKAVCDWHISNEMLYVHLYYKLYAKYVCTCTSSLILFWSRKINIGQVHVSSSRRYSYPAFNRYHSNHIF